MKVAVAVDELRVLLDVAIEAGLVLAAHGISQFGLCPKH
jgi:putative NIF3 family GTP cyclohydrolase 1 type 2